MFYAFRSTKKENWINAGYWLFMSSIGGLMPLWGSFLMLNLLKQNVSLQNFSNNGEFALYSASIISASIYIINKDYIPPKLKQLFKDKNTPSIIKAGFPYQLLFSSLSLIILTVSTFLFSGVAFGNIPGSSLSIDTNLLATITIIIFVFTILLCYIITVLDESASGQSEEDIRNLLKSSGNELEARFDSLDKEA
jgi:hypothetical protein